MSPGRSSGPVFRSGHLPWSRRATMPSSSGGSGRMARHDLGIMAGDDEVVVIGKLAHALALVGKSGCGKSTLGRGLAGIRYKGRDRWFAGAAGFGAETCPARRRPRGLQPDLGRTALAPLPAARMPFPHPLPAGRNHLPRPRARHDRGFGPSSGRLSHDRDRHGGGIAPGRPRPRVRPWRCLSADRGLSRIP